MNILQQKVAGAEQSGSKHLMSTIAESKSYNNHYMVMPLAKTDLFSILENGPIRNDDVKKYMRQIIEAVKHMHSRDVIHMDLSVENVLLSMENNVIVCDFGLSRVQKQESDMNGIYGGKIRYMAPERLTGGPFSGFMSDVFSIGVILFVMLTRTNPFESATLSCDSFRLMVYEKKMRDLLKHWNLSDLVSEEAEELILGMICLEKERMTLSEVSEHSFLN